MTGHVFLGHYYMPGVVVGGWGWGNFSECRFGYYTISCINQDGVRASRRDNHLEGSAGIAVTSPPANPIAPPSYWIANWFDHLRPKKNSGSNHPQGSNIIRVGNAGSSAVPLRPSRTTVTWPKWTCTWRTWTHCLLARPHLPSVITALARLEVLRVVVVVWHWFGGEAFPPPG